MSATQHLRCCSFTRKEHMRKNILLVLLIPILGLLLLYLPGCMEVQKYNMLSEEEAVEQVTHLQMEYDFPEGHMTLVTVEKGHIAGEFTSKEDITVQFEVIRIGKNSSAALMYDPDSPRFIADARFISKVSGEHFDVRAGGHNLEKQLWREKTADCFFNECKGVPQDFRDKEFAITRYIAKNLDTIKKDLPEFIHFEVDTLIEMGSYNPMGLHGEIGEPEAYEHEEELSQYPEEVLLKSGGYIHNVEVKYKYIFGSSRAHHSSTYIYSSRGNSRYSASETCNHGTCARSSRMRFRCIEQSLNRYRYLPHYGECGRSSRDDHPNQWMCCPTEYGLSRGKHVCNDDTKLQLDSVRGLHSNPNMSYCRDNSLRNRVPSCRSAR